MTRISCRLAVSSCLEVASDPALSELHRLDELGIVRLDFAYRDNGRRDRYGNLLRYWSKATMLNGRGEEKQIDTCDVIFVKAKPVPSPRRD
jgi:hypothetical protein